MSLRKHSKDGPWTPDLTPAQTLLARGAAALLQGWKGCGLFASSAWGNTHLSLLAIMWYGSIPVSRVLHLHILALFGSHVLRVLIHLLLMKEAALCWSNLCPWTGLKKVRRGAHAFPTWGKYVSICNANPPSKMQSPAAPPVVLPTSPSAQTSGHHWPGHVAGKWRSSMLVWLVKHSCEQDHRATFPETPGHWWYGSLGPPGVRRGCPHHKDAAECRVLHAALCSTTALPGAAFPHPQQSQWETTGWEVLSQSPRRGWGHSCEVPEGISVAACASPRGGSGERCHVLWATYPGSRARGSWDSSELQGRQRWQRGQAAPLGPGSSHKHVLLNEMRQLEGTPTG